MASEKSKVIFGNPIKASVWKKAEKKRLGYLRKYGDDSLADYRLRAAPNDVIGRFFGVKDVRVGGEGEELSAKDSLAIGCIRMGYGHYRPAMAIASAAKSMGLTPYWFDFMAAEGTTAAKVISELNGLYSLGSRWSQKYPLFNKLYWEPLNSEGFKKIAYNSGDQAMTELMVPLFKNLPKDMPFVGTHPWNSQAAVHAGMKRVVNMVVDNWPMALHLAEGAIHTVQGPSAWMGYRMLREFSGEDRALKMMPPGSIAMTGHIVDHEMVANLEADCALRAERVARKKPRRLLLSVGGAGAQRETIASIIRNLMPDVEAGRAALLLNVGDHKNVWEGLERDIPALGRLAIKHFGDWDETVSFCRSALSGEVSGVHAFWHPDVFAAVYATNLLMRCADVLATKPSELSFYPVPKLFIKRIGGHEAWGAIRGAELGDGTIECASPALLKQAIDLLFRDDELLPMMCDAIRRQGSIGTYDGAYRVVELATGKKRKKA
jgi:hypothetical protein